MKNNFLNLLLMMALGMFVVAGCNDTAIDSDATDAGSATEDAGAEADGEETASTEHATVEVTMANFEELTNGDTPILLDFWASWCGPCMKLTPTLEELAHEYDGKLIIGKVNVDEQKELAQKFNVNGIPALFYVKNGEVVADQVGLMPKDKLVSKIEEVLAQ